MEAMTLLKPKVCGEIVQTARGRVRCQIVQRGRVVKTFPWQNNLILNQGLDNVCTDSQGWAGQTAHCCAGTGVTNTNNGTLAGQTGSGAATTFTGPGSFDFTTSASIGDMLKMTTGSSSGTEVRITAVTDATHVQYTPSATISTGEFVVYRTSQTGLSAEVKRNNAWNNAGGYMGNTHVSNTTTMLRTFEFSAEVGSVTYTELGISPTGSAGTNLFSRIKLVSPVALVAGQQLRVSYQLAVTFNPSTLTAKTFNITGWPIAPAASTDGDERWQNRGIYLVAGDANSSAPFAVPIAGTPYSVMDPAAAGGQIFVATASTTPGAFGTSPGYGGAVGKTFTLASYTNLNFFRDRSATFTVLEAVGTLWRSIGLCAINDSGTTGTCFACVFDDAQTKDNLRTLTLTFRLTVGRVLS